LPKPNLFKVYRSSQANITIIIRSDSDVSDTGWNWGQKFQKGDDPYKCEILIRSLSEKIESFKFLISSIAACGK